MIISRYSPLSFTESSRSELFSRNLLFCLLEAACSRKVFPLRDWKAKIFLFHFPYVHVERRKVKVCMHEKCLLLDHPSEKVFLSPSLRSVIVGGGGVGWGEGTTKRKFLECHTSRRNANEKCLLVRPKKKLHCWPLHNSQYFNLSLVNSGPKLKMNIKNRIRVRMCSLRGQTTRKKFCIRKGWMNFFLFFALLFVCLFRAFAKPKVTQPSRVELVLFFHSSPACSLSNRTSYAWAGDSDRLGRREKFYFFLLLVFGRFSAHMRENELEIGLERGQDR